MKGDSKVKRVQKRAQYIGALRYCLQAREDFGKLEYIVDVLSEQEYLILTDVIGQVCFLNITGYNDAMILHTMAQIECGTVPSNLVTDKAEMMRIARLR